LGANPERQFLTFFFSLNGFGRKLRHIGNEGHLGCLRAAFV